MNLSKYPDEEINMMAARIAQPEIDWYVETGECRGLPRGWAVKVAQGIEVDYETADYCSDDALAFRLMVDNGLGVFQLRDGMWTCHKGHFSSFHKNPNRSIAECYVLMNQENEK